MKNAVGKTLGNSARALLRSASRAAFAAAMAVALTVAASTAASAETRTLKLYYIHTKEKIEVTYKKDGRYIKSGLDKLNRFLRDWRRNEPTKMDPALFDIVWEAYKASRSREYIHVVSAYRSPATNAMLRRTRGGQASKSQHMLGKAMDFYIPGVKVSKIREIGFKIGGGGVGYYPKSGVPFVHLDTGNVRAWPRMSRGELTRLFPDGKTMHLPPDGKPLPGYKQAVAAYQSRKRGGGTVIAEARSSEPRKNLLAAIFGGGADDEEDTVESSAPAAVATKPAAKPEPAPVAKPEPAPETPGTLIAALPARALPKPIAAPRSNRGGVPVTITPEAPVEVAAAPQAVAEPVPSEPVAVAAAPVPTFEPPVPGRRPAVLIARAEAPIDRRSAQEIEAALAIANADAGQTIETAAAPVADAADGADAIAAAISEREPEVAPVALAYNPPIPAPAPRATQPEATVAVAKIPAPEAILRRAAEFQAAETVVAYAPPAAERVGETVEPVLAKNGKGGRVAPAPLGTDETATAALNTNVSTTEKAGRATPQDMPELVERQPSVVPAEEIDQSRFGDWVTTASLVTTDGRPSERPDFLQNATRAAPDVVYAQGFSKTPAPDANSFSGNAVTFLAVARFGGGTGGGDGEPLQLSIPN